MMRLPSFRFVDARTVREAATALQDAGSDGAPVAGGTDLLPNMKRLQVSPSVVVGLGGIRELRGIRTDGTDLVIGAGTTLTQLARSELVRRSWAPLVEAVLTISTPLLRNMGTVGGNLCLDTRCHFLNQSAFWRKSIGSCMKAEGETCLVAPGSDRCWAITSSDLPPLLIALGARIRLVGASGERVLPLSDFYCSDGIRYLAKDPGEVLTELIVPAMEEKRAGYLKLRRRDTFDFPALGVAASLSIDSGGICRDAHIVLGAVTSRPLVMPEAGLLKGREMDEEALQSVTEALRKSAKPLHLADYNHTYRKQMVGIYARRLLEQLCRPNAASREGN